MKNLLATIAFFVLLILPFSVSADEEKLTLSGFYQQKNLYIQNQSGQDGFGFTIRSIYINGNVYPTNNNSRAIEIDFTAIGLKKGEPVEVLISYEGIKPRVLNPQSILPESTCIYKKIQADDRFIEFATAEEAGSLNFYIQHFRWNKWINVGEVKGEGTPALHRYRFQVRPNTGENLYRVAQIRHSGKLNISPIVTIHGDSEEVTFEKNENSITFSRPTYYEVHDIYGNLLQKGHGQNIQLKAKKGIGIYLSYDNNTELIKK